MYAMHLTEHSALTLDYLGHMLKDKTAANKVQNASTKRRFFTKDVYGYAVILTAHRWTSKAFQAT